MYLIQCVELRGTLTYNIWQLIGSYTKIIGFGPVLPNPHPPRNNRVRNLELEVLKESFQITIFNTKMSPKFNNSKYFLILMEYDLVK